MGRCCRVRWFQVVRKLLTSRVPETCPLQGPTSEVQLPIDQMAADVHLPGQDAARSDDIGDHHHGDLMRRIIGSVGISRINSNIDPAINARCPAAHAEHISLSACCACACPAHIQSLPCPLVTVYTDTVRKGRASKFHFSPKISAFTPSHESRYET